MRELIRKYYSYRPLEEPVDLHKREVALESLEDGAYIRHLSFPYMSMLYEYILSRKTPLHLYYSSALYAVPDASNMESKVWEGSELLFDIDADKYEGCNEKLWFCPNSGEVYTSEISSCPRGEKPTEITSIPWACIARAWSSALKLVDIIENDFGYNKIKVYFSGNRGFHVKVLDQGALQLGREERRAIADYVSCSGLDLNKVFPAYKGKVVFKHPEHGLRKRVFNVAAKRSLLERREVRGLKDVGFVDLEQVKVILAEVCVDVDKAVTMDITRLSRFGNSLNMKAGLKVTELSLNTDISKLDYEDFSPFKGYLRVKSLITSSVSVMGRKIDLSKDSVYSLNAYLGIYLVVKGLVIPVDTSNLEVKV